VDDIGAPMETASRNS